MNLGSKGMEWGCADADALENKTVSRFSWCLRVGTAFQSFKFNLWFVRAVGEIITKQPR